MFLLLSNVSPLGGRCVNYNLFTIFKNVVIHISQKRPPSQQCLGSCRTLRI